MKRFFLFLALVILVFALYGCGRSYNPKVETFETHLRYLSEDPEDAVDLEIRYNQTFNLEEAFTTLAGYTSKDWYVSANDAEDAWIYVSHYIDALHAEIDELYRLYLEAY